MIMMKKSNPIDEIIMDTRLSPHDKLLMITLIFNQQKMNTWTNKQLANYIGFHQVTIKNSLDKLRFLRYIGIQFNSYDKNWRYIQIINY